MHVDIELHGYVCGKIWWPVGAKCGKPLRMDLKRERGRFTEKPDLRDLIGHVLCENGGDFQFAMLTADSEIVFRIARQDGNRRAVKTISRPVTDFPSIADYVDAETESFEFVGEEG